MALAANGLPMGDPFLLGLRLRANSDKEEDWLPVFRTEVGAV